MKIIVRDTLRDTMEYAQNKIDNLADTYDFKQWYHLSQASIELERQRLAK